MSILKQPTSGPATWKTADVDADQSWRMSLTPSFITAVDNALAHLTTTSLTYPDFEKNDFPFSSQQSFLSSLAEELENGRGFFVLKGLPIERYTLSQIKSLYFGIGLHLGTPVCQNQKGDLLGTVTNVGNKHDKNTRVYETNDYLPYHTDLSDVFGLICIRQAKKGGLTSLVSGGAVYNELLNHYPEYLGLLYRSMPYAHLGDGINRTPLFSYHDNKLTCRYLRQYIELEHKRQGQPLSTVEVDALDRFDEIIHRQDMRLDLMLKPGDMLFANNYSVMHSRTGFEDYTDPEQRRLLLRLWLKMPNARQLAPEFPGQNGFPSPHSV